MTRSYFRYAAGIILMYDDGRRETLWDLEDWVESVQKYSLWNWQEYVTFVLWGNNSNQSNYPVSSDDLKQFMSGVQCGLTDEQCFSLNAYTGRNVCQSYHAVLESIHSRLKKAKEPDNIENATHIAEREKLLDGGENGIKCSC